LADTQLDWYARTIAARILAKVPSQHAYLLECLRREQSSMGDDSEATAILRQELAYGAFKKIKSSSKQLALLQLICSDKSPILHRLAIYLLQQPECKIGWNSLSKYHEKMSMLLGLVNDLGLSTDNLKPCFIAQTLTKTYKVNMTLTDLRPYYLNHYDKAVENLRESVISFQKSPSSYASNFHQFSHVTIIAFYEYYLSSENGIYASNYAALLDRRNFKEIFPNSVDIWKSLNEMRNRVDHPVDRRTQSHSRKPSVREVEFLYKQLQVALQDMFNIWLSPSTKITVTSNAIVRSSSNTNIL
jgi:hypothetical protein